MSGLTNFLTPYSHLIFANRDKVIVVLALVLGWTVIQLLVARWRTERLQRDLTTARSTPAAAPVRARHLPPQIVEEAPAETGGLPPIKGGRSYARNLGSALQKAGIPAASPQIYSPPVPAGWSPNTGNNQQGPAQPPMQPPTYAPPAAPWGAPAAQPQAPWAYPAGANRPAFGAQPNSPMPAPYSPQPGAGAPGPTPQTFPQQPFPPQYPHAGQAPFPQPFGPTAPPTEFARQNVDAPPVNSSAPGVTAPPQMPPTSAPAIGGAFAPPPAPEVAGDGDSKESGRRGKPKRRRFNLSVLDNLEKMVQSKTADTSAQPAAPTAPPAGTPAAPIAPPSATPSVPFPTPVVTSPTLFEPAPVAEESSPEVGPSREEESTEAYAELQAMAQEPPAAEPEAPQEEPRAEAEEPSRKRPNMRAMLFGEESPAARAETPEPIQAEEPARQEEEPTADAPVEATASWPSAETIAQEEPLAEFASSETADAHEVAAEPVAEAPVVEEEVAPEATWEPEPEVVQAEAEPSVAAIEAPAEGDGDSTPAAGDAGVLVIIEDDQAAAEYYATLFRGNGYNVNVANDGISGVDLCVRVQPQVILLDVMMPRQNGILVLQTLRASDETRNTPVVVMSNFSEPTLIKRALQLGALEYVIKTQVEGAALLNALPRWMNREKAFAA